MAYAHDLLGLADRLLQDEPDLTQAALRRAISTAYYALFHLLIDEAVSNWAITRHRSRLARTFEHAAMKKVCDDQIKNFHSAGEPVALVHLAKVAEAFVELQKARLIADYDNAKVWTQPEAQEWIGLTKIAFTHWSTLHTEDTSQDFLLSLFLPKLTRQ